MDERQIEIMKKVKSQKKRHANEWKKQGNVKEEHKDLKKEAEERGHLFHSRIPIQTWKKKKNEFHPT